MARGTVAMLEAQVVLLGVRTRSSRARRQHRFRGALVAWLRASKVCVRAIMSVCVRVCILHMCVLYGSARPEGACCSPRLGGGAC